MTVRTIFLDQAAFYMAWGAPLTEIKGKYPQNFFVLEVPRWVIFYEKAVGLVNYAKFGAMRREIKKRSRKQAGLPEFFTGHNGTGFTFGEIAHLKGEKQDDVR